ncbi:hypothetical protein EGW08_006399 [Elysia chlorotica]|uniref:Sulfotransferase domain-containing protein n=1 Tax=Elysia chlorotica TaxID=188477 RepID=A0A3S1A962_ELYCH|nr:hypothetical protein EGW08_006399 [Elysia chlorotica]
MGVLKVVKKQFLSFIIFTGIMNLILSTLKPFISSIMTFLVRNQKIMLSNYQVVDASGKTMNMVRLNGKVYPPFGEDNIRKVSTLSIRDDDVLLCGYPKTGCHWMYEVISMLLRGKAELSPHGKGFGGMIEAVPEILLDSLPSPRVLNSHLLYAELPKQIREKKTKIILTTRNPKDTVVSFYNHHLALKNFYGYDGSFTDYFNLFLNGRLDYGDFFDHVLDWKKTKKNQSCNQILIVPFEDMKLDPFKCVYEIADFLKIKVTEKLAGEIIDACSFNRMKKKRAKDGPAAKLFRKGIVGDWKNWMSTEQSAAIDKRWAQTMQNSS